jgi:uncharacterized membrane-anchored protein
MIKHLRTVILFGTLAVFLYLVNSNIIRAEQRIASGTPVYLELATFDDRSLIQGDYMTLRYSIESAIATQDTADDTRRGQIVAVLNENNVARYDRFYTEGEPLAENEVVINYRKVNGSIQIGTDAFFFQETLADTYADAEYAEVRVTEGGGVMLVDLVGEDFAPLVE